MCAYVLIFIYVYIYIYQQYICKFIYIYVYIYCIYVCIWVVWFSLLCSIKPTVYSHIGYRTKVISMVCLKQHIYTGALVLHGKKNNPTCSMNPFHLPSTRSRNGWLLVWRCRSFQIRPSLRTARWELHQIYTHCDRLKSSLVNTGPAYVHLQVSHWAAPAALHTITMLLQDMHIYIYVCINTSLYIYIYTQSYNYIYILNQAGSSWIMPWRNHDC